MIRIIASLALVLSLVSVSFADNGLVSVKSSHSVKDTTDRLVKALESKGMTVFNRINHAEGAKRLGAPCCPPNWLYWKPQGRHAIDDLQPKRCHRLTSKSIDMGRCSGSGVARFNDPAYLAERHGISDCKEVLQKVAGALKNFAAAATQP